MGGEDEGITLGEVSRKLDDFRSEMRDAMKNAVPRGEFEENRKAQGERIGSIEKDVTEVKSALSTINRVAWTGLVIPILVTVLAAVILAAIGVKG